MERWNKVSQSDQKVGYKTITTKVFKMPNGNSSEWTTYGKTGEQSAAVLALTKDNLVVLARQFRPGPEIVMDELPGGAVDKDEMPEEAARRELKEETGYVSDESFEYLGKAWRDGYSNAPAHFFLARNCYKAERQNLEEDEIIEVVTSTIDEYIEVVHDGRTSDPMALALAYESLMKVRNA